MFSSPSKHTLTERCVSVLGSNYDLYFSGTAPQHLRLHYFLAEDTTKPVRLAIYFGLQQRYDVYHEGKFLHPSNAEIDDKNKVTYKSPKTEGEFLPTAASPSGANFFDIDTKTLYVQVKGRGLIDIKMRPVVILAFGLPEMTEEEFFGKDLLKNLIIFLKVDPAKVRIAGVRRIGQSRRHKRGTGGIEVIVEIGMLGVFINSNVSQDCIISIGCRICCVV